MNELINTTEQLPDTLKDLTKFVLVGREKLNAVRAEIRAIDKVGLAKEVREQKLHEAQDIADAVLDAEMKIGELMKKIPKATPNNNIFHEIRPDSNLAKKKSVVTKELGFSKDQVSQFQQMAENEEAVHEAIAEARENDDIVSRASVMKKIKAETKAKKKEEKAKAKEYETPKIIPDTCKLFTADICNGLNEIPDESVDFIITDPPYPKEYIPLYSELSKVAERVLKDGGSMLVMCGQSYLPEVMQRLTERMEYHWTLCYLTPGGQSPSLWQKNTNTFWKPIIWLTKGKYLGDYIGDVIKTEVNSNDKRFHKWGQSENGMASILEKFTYPNDVILDPFVGGGTVGVCAVAMGRKFIGCDISSECIETTRERITEALNVTE